MDMLQSASNVDNQQGHAAWKCSKCMRYGHVAWAWSTDLQHGPAAWTSSMDIQVVISKTCSFYMQQGLYRHHGHGHAAQTCSMDMLHRNAARTCNLDMQHEHAVWTSSIWTSSRGMQHLHSIVLQEVRKKGIFRRFSDEHFYVQTSRVYTYFLVAL